MGLRYLFLQLSSPQVAILYSNFVILNSFLWLIGLQIVLRSRIKVPPFMLVGVAPIIGHITLFIVLSLLGYIVQGPSLIFLSTILLGIFYVFGIKKSSIFIVKNIKSVLFYQLIFVISALIAGNSVYGGDTTTYWGIATSFARGNYPIHMPWQPQYLPVYHIAPFVISGWFWSLSKMGIWTVHTLLSATWLVGLWFCLWSFVTTLKISRLWSLLLGLFIMVLSGGPLLWIGGRISQVSTYELLRGAAGAGANSIPALVYANFQLLGIVLAIFLCYLLAKKASSMREIVFIGLGICAVLSTDESLFPALLLAAAPLLWKLINNKLFLHLAIFLITLGVGFFAFQNAIRDSMFTPANPSRFLLVIPGSSEWLSRLSVIGSNGPGPIVLLPQLFVLLFVFWFSFKKKYELGKILSLFAAGCLLCGMIITNTYWSGNAVRLLNTASRLENVGFFLLIFLFTRSKKILTQILVGILIIASVPSIAFEATKLLNVLREKKHENLTLNIQQNDQVLLMVGKHLSSKERLLIIDEYPKSGVYSPLTLNAIQYYGITVPLFASDIKMLNAETGGEWYDAVSSLDPETIKKMKVTHLLITGSGKERLNKELIKYKLKYVDNVADTGLYKIISVPDATSIPTIDVAMSTIRKDETVFISKFSDPSVRRGIIELLYERETLLGPMYSVGGDWYMYREKRLPVMVDKKNISNETYGVIEASVTSIDGYRIIYSHPAFNVWQKK